MILETLVVELIAEAKKFKEGLQDSEQETEGWAKKLGGNVTKLAAGALVAGSAAAVAAVGAIGVAAMGAWSEFDEASDNLINATGASGDALKAMEESVKNLYSSTAGLGVSMGDIGAVMGEVSTRTGLTGQDLESLTGTIMNFSRMTGTDGVNATANLTSVMGQWGIGMDQASVTLNKLYGAGQAFGISFDQISAQLTKFGPQLQNLGFSFEESVGLLGQWEKNGVNSQQMLMGLTAASAKFAADNIPVQEGLQATIERIQNAGSETEALGIAYEVFGRKAGAEMVAAIQKGNLSLEDSAAIIAASGTALDEASVNVLDFPDAWEMATKQITTALIPLGQSLANLISALLPAITDGIGFVVDAIGPLVDWLAKLFNAFADSSEGGEGFKGMMENLPGPLRAVGMALDSAMGWLRGFGDVVMEKGAGTLEYFKGWIDQNLPLIQQIFQTVLNAIQGFWTLFGDDIMRVVDFVFGTVWTIIDTALRNIGDLISAFLLFLTGDFEGGFDKLTEIAGRTVTAVVEIIGNLATLVWDTISGIDWGELGRSIVQGMIDGILNMSQRLWDAAESLSRSLWDRMTSWWNTGSPSRKSEQGLGIPIAQGIIKGLEGGIMLAPLP